MDAATTSLERFDLLPEALGEQPAYLFGVPVVLLATTSDILPEAHASHPSRLTLACTIAGAGFMWLVIGLAGS